MSPSSSSLMWLVLAPLVIVMMGIADGVVVDVGDDDGGLSDVFWDAIGTVSLDHLVTHSLVSTLNQSCFEATDHYSNLRKCLRSQCVNADDVARLYKVTSDHGLEASNLSKISAGVLYLLTSRQPACTPQEPQTHPDSPTAAAVWGYGLMFVTLINVCSMLGACVWPCINTALYKMLLLFMVALAVGTLVGSGLLVLIPEALGLAGDGDKRYLWTLCVVMCGIYLFLLVERGMRYVTNRRQNTKDKKARDELATEGTYTSFFQMHSSENPHAQLRDAAHIGISNRAFAEDDQSRQSSAGDTATLAEMRSEHGQEGGSTTTSTTPTNTERNSQEGPSLGGRGGPGEPVKIAPVAYMIIFGDALHNLIDGLSIGAAFTESTLLGISLSVAVLCEELPHELGDFAILLNSGMSLRKALAYNLLSSFSSYVGLIIGIQLGENTEANTWIFAIAGGMFLYISLADMLPEMNCAAESPEAKEFGEVKTFLVQNLGLIVGFGIILLLAVYGDLISFI